MLNTDIYRHIFDILPISDKRSFIRTCEITHALSIHMPNVEASFQMMINDTGFFHNSYYSGFYNSLYKHTIELLYDDYPIPDRYIIIENRILHQYPKIYKRLAEKNKFQLIKKMLKLDRNSFSEENAEYVMRGAAKVGNICILKQMLDDYNGYDSATRYAAKGGQLKTLKWLIKHNFEIDDSAVACAAGKGHRDVVDFLIFNKDCPAKGYLAAYNGHFDIVKHLHSIDKKSLHQVCDGAALAGHLDILQFAYENGATLYADFNCEHLHILIWLLDNGHIQPNITTSQSIAQTGNLECLQFLYANKFPVLEKSVFEKAVISKNIKMIEWLRDLNCPFDKFVVDDGVVNAFIRAKAAVSLQILKLLVKMGCVLDDSLCPTAACYGGLKMLKYLYTHGCKLTNKVIEAAAFGGHLHIIIWARRHGCGWDTEACKATACWNHLNILRWLRGFDRKTCELPSDETEICPWDEQICISAIRFRHNDILNFALENGCKISAEAIEKATGPQRYRDD